MKAIHGGQANNDTIDSPKLAVVLGGGMLPQADVSSADMRATRDLLRRRRPRMRTRAAWLAHSHTTKSPYHLPDIGKQLAYTANRDGVAERFPEPAVQQRMEGALALINHDDCLLGDRELSILNTATPHHAQTRYLRRPGPGSGERLSLVLRYEIHDLGRFPWVPDVVSSGRLVQCPQEAAGKWYGTSGTTIGHASLPGAFSAAAGLGRRTTPAGQQYLTKLANKPGKGNAFTLLAQKLGRAVYDIFKRHTACEMRRFLSGAWSGADEPNASLDDHGLSLSFVLGHAGIAAS